MERRATVSMPKSDYDLASEEPIGLVGYAQDCTILDRQSWGFCAIVAQIPGITPSDCGNFYGGAYELLHPGWISLRSVQKFPGGV
jgi:hypothetical protein